jgi:type VI secretion system secreted protein VgrG
MNPLSPISGLATLTIDLRCDDAPPTGISVRSFDVLEQIDGDYRATVVIASEQEIMAQKLLGADCALVFARDGVEGRSLCGVVERVEDLGEVNHRQFVRLEVAPAFALLGYGRNSRIWQHMSVRDIVRKVLQVGLADYGRTFDFAQTIRGDRVRDYCVQYSESDHAFVRRLLEEEGMAYIYVHDTEAKLETLTLRDASSQYPKLDEAVIPVIDHDSTEANIESISSIASARTLTVTSVLRRDYRWGSPREMLTEPKGGVDERQRDRRIYQHQHRRYVRDDLVERASDVLAAERVHAQTLFGKGNVSTFMPGVRFTLFNGASDLDGNYLLTSVKHLYTDNEEAGGTYHNEFACIPADTEYRPRQRTPKPRVHGPHTATVVGDEEIHTDEHGRIQVQFHWEETPSFATGASGWIRCAQSWAGPGWGIQFIPRVGMEVIVEFIEGNPDRPLVIGCVYNGLNEVPFALPQHKTQSGLQTRSSPNSDGYNMLRFEDAAGHESIKLRAQRDLTEVVLNEHSTRVGANQTNHVGCDQCETVCGKQTLTVRKNRRVTIDGSQSVTISGAQPEDGVSGSKLNIVGDYKVDVSQTVEVQAPIHIRLTCGNSSLTLEPDQITLICGNSSLRMDPDQIQANAGGLAWMELNTNAVIASREASTLALDANVVVQSSGGSMMRLDNNALVRSSGHSSVSLDSNASVRSAGGGHVRVVGSDVELNVP